MTGIGLQHGVLHHVQVPAALLCGQHIQAVLSRQEHAGWASPVRGLPCRVLRPRDGGKDEAEPAPGAGAEDAASGQPADSAQSTATVEGTFGAESEWEAPGAAEEGSSRPADAAAGAPSKRQQRRQQQREESAKRSRNRGPGTGRGQGPRGRGARCCAFARL